MKKLKTCKATDFSRGKAAKYFDEVSNNNEIYVVTNHGNPAVVVLSASEYERIARRKIKLSND